LEKAPADKNLNMMPKGSSNFGAPPLGYEIPFSKINKQLEKCRITGGNTQVTNSSKSGSRMSGRGRPRIALTLGYQTGRLYSDQPMINPIPWKRHSTGNLNLVISTQASIGSDSLKAM